MSTEAKNEQSIGMGNRYIHHCDIYDSRRFYGICLHIIEATQIGSLRPDYSTPMGDCAVQVDKGICPALVMRRQEIAAGAPLFYEESDRPEAAISTTKIAREIHQYMRGWNRVGNAIGKPEGNYNIVRTEIPASTASVKQYQSEEQKAPEKPPVKRAVSLPETPAKSGNISIADMSFGALITEMAREEQAPEKKPVTLLDIARQNRLK